MERKWIRDRGRKKKGNVRTTTEALIAKAETDRCQYTVQPYYRGRPTLSTNYSEVLRKVPEEKQKLKAQMVTLNCDHKNDMNIPSSGK
ncbi:hypothetical protein F2P79_017712 [Pimephales promelas]|nr:hypothetical protein F2P79_017712 [Pimephales promelas]